MATSDSDTRILGPHPPASNEFGATLGASDLETANNLEHRVLGLLPEQASSFHDLIRRALIAHHGSSAMHARNEAMKRQGLGATQARMSLYPTSETTRKGNLAEVVLAEYVVATTGTTLPVYRLRYNPNIDQSMKGDDVLTFDLAAVPARIIVGEAKFRQTSTAAVAKEIVSTLETSHRGGVPVSLQFVANLLFEAGSVDLGERVLACAALFVSGRLRIDYVGLLFSDEQSAQRVHKNAPGSALRLALISLGVPDASGAADACYSGLD